MNKKKIIIGYFCGFLTSIFLVLLILLLIAKFTILNKNYVMKAIENNNYYEKIYNEINDEMELQLLSTGFTNEILKDIYKMEEVIDDINLFIKNAYLGKTTILDKSDIRYRIKINIDNYFKQTKLSISNKNELNKFVNDLVNKYVEEICLYGYTDSVITKIPKLSKLVNIGLISSIVILIILCFILIKYTKSKYFSSIIIASGLIILFIRLFIFEKIDIDNILIITEDFSEILRNYLNFFRNTLLSLSIILIIVGGIIIIVESICKPSKK